MSSLSNAMLVSSSHAQKQHKENPLLTRLLDGSSSSTGLSVGGGSMSVEDRNEVAPSSSVATEESSNSFGKVRAEKKAEEENVVKCIDSSDKGVDEADQDDKMLIDEEEETSKENQKPREDTSSSPLSTLAITTSRNRQYHLHQVSVP